MKTDEQHAVVRRTSYNVGIPAARNRVVYAAVSNFVELPVKPDSETAQLQATSDTFTPEYLILRSTSRPSVFQYSPR